MRKKVRLGIAGPFGLKVKGTARARIVPLAVALQRKGFEVKVFLPPWDSPSDSGKVERIWDVEIHHITLPPRIPLAYHFLIALNLARACFAFKPDLVWAFKPVGYTGLATALLRSLGIRVVVDADDWEGKGGWSERNPYPLLWRTFIPFQEKWVLTHADAISVASRALQTIAWSMGVREDRVLYLPNGVEDLPHLGPGSWKAVGLYTRFVEFTPEDLLQIWLRILAMEPDAELLIVGKGFNSEEEEFLSLARRAGVERSIQVKGWMDREKALALLGKTRVAIWPSRDNLINRAKCPAKLAELVAIGLPVVAENVGEASTYVLPELLVESGSYDEFAGKVIMLLKDEAMAREMGRRGRERLLSRFSWDFLAEKFVHFVEGLGIG